MEAQLQEQLDRLERAAREHSDINYLPVHESPHDAHEVRQHPHPSWIRPTEGEVGRMLEMSSHPTHSDAARDNG